MNLQTTFCVAYICSDIAASVMSSSISVQCCIHFPATSVGMTGESGHWAKLLQHIPNVLTGVKVWTLVADPRVKTMSHHPWTTLSQSESDESWHWCLEICLQGRMVMNNLIIHYIQAVSWARGPLLLLKLAMSKCSNPSSVLFPPGLSSWHSAWWLHLPLLTLVPHHSRTG